MTRKKEEDDKAVAELTVGREDTEERRQLVAAVAELTAARDDADSKLAALRENDPAVLEELSGKVDTCKAAVNRWTDNAWNMKSYIVRKHGISSSEVDRMLQIPADMDYVE